MWYVVVRFHFLLILYSIISSTQWLSLVGPPLLCRRKSCHHLYLFQGLRMYAALYSRHTLLRIKTKKYATHPLPLPLKYLCSSPSGFSLPFFLSLGFTTIDRVCLSCHTSWQRFILFYFYISWVVIFSEWLPKFFLILREMYLFFKSLVTVIFIYKVYTKYEWCSALAGRV